MSYNVAIIGAGLIGKKRASALANFDNCRLVAVADINPDSAYSLASQFNADFDTEWNKIVRRKDVDIVIVSTLNKFIAPASIESLESNKHVLSEKPLGRDSHEAEKILDAAKKNGKIVKTGFNHRFHPAVSQAKKIADQGQIGKIIFIRARYGHGGRPGYEKEWRANKDLCGGGELLDQGVHVVDLFRWFAGDFDEAFGYIQTCFWDMQVEDNAFAMFKNNAGVIATMHTSWTQWKNLFSFEVFGDKGYLIIEGLGGSYGIETLKIGRRKIEGGKPDEEIEKFSGPDISWQEEWREFIQAIENNKEPIGNGWDGYQANRMIGAVYESTIKKKVIKL